LKENIQLMIHNTYNDKTSHRDTGECAQLVGYAPFSVPLRLHASLFALGLPREEIPLRVPERNILHHS